MKSFRIQIDVKAPDEASKETMIGIAGILKRNCRRAVTEGTKRARPHNVLFTTTISAIIEGSFTDDNWRKEGPPTPTVIVPA